ncbi:MAG: hypothetical protein K1060chlam5_00275 [Candidatus Anoxychlamydiales bacterium]|nr:hypothetical protein [Candidatus Anoxychlamydiales bacterium]
MANIRTKKNKMTIFDKFIDFFFIKSWWVFLFALICYIGYENGIKKRNKDIFEMKSRYTLLEKQKDELSYESKDLEQRINSQSDPQWVEQVLMRELGVVPEDQLKVHFTDK